MSDRDDVIKRALADVDFRSQLASSMVAPIRSRLDYSGAARKAFAVEELVPCPTCKRADREEGHRAGCDACTIWSVMET